MRPSARPQLAEINFGGRGPEDAAGHQQAGERADPRGARRRAAERAKIEEKSRTRIDKILQPDELRRA